ncbi:ParB/RepB/Spo0J family partition protein [Blautia sp. Marseille-P3087]|uniref:ParB/RepB/Spo0J family partition protein n=1 Tax=Blautia sp. Marseille-P3087 TaxID=1917876 RepID=UPI0009306E3C|nr:ParB N-terminal domain-containing protein [Blautia sp. Marseille-P3087]
MAKFDLKGMLSERSSQEMTIPEQKTVYRNPEDLIPSKDNFYSTEDTEKLKQSIKALGILQPLLIEERDGKDYILAGHSRRKCCLELIEEGMDRFRKIPCVYKPKIELSTASEEDEIIRKIIIIQSNTYREKSDWEKMTEALQMEELVKELREKTDLEGKTREIVSDLIGVSSTQIGRYHSINSNLSESLMNAFKQNKLNISTAAELSGLNEKYQTQACELLENAGQLALNDAKLLKAQQEQERNIPGQLTIEQVLHPHKPEEVNTVIPVDIQIDRFYESLRKNIETYVRKSDLNMTTYMLSALYGTVRVRNGHLNYQGSKEGIIFNTGSDQEELISWTDFSKKLIEKYGKKQKPVKMAAVDEPEELTIKEAITTFHDEFPNKFARMMRAIRPAKNNHESAVMAQKVLAPCGFSSLSGSSVMNYEFRGMSAGAKFECKGRTLNTSYRYLVEQARFMYDPFSPEFDDPEDQSAAGVPDNLQQDDFVEATKIEEHIVENNKMSDHAGDITEMASADSFEISIQPPLPVMKNNDQRKEWLRKYKEWGLWYTDEHIGARYYKYDFENGTRLIVEEYDPEPVHNSPWAPNEPYYMHLVGGPEPERNNGIPKWTYHSKYNKYPNSETELVEFLKGVQK